MSENDSVLPFISNEDFFNEINTNPNIMIDGKLPCVDQHQMWMKIGRQVNIIITQVSSPYKFWFLKKSAMDELKYMMKSLGLTYRNCNMNDFKIPKHELKVGLICVAIYRDQFHRARITKVFDKIAVTVFYVDFGTTETIYSDDLLYLHKQFSDYPEQALHGCLDMIRPIGGTWTYDSIEHFFNLVKYRTIYAKIKSMNEKENVFYMKLSHMLENGEIVPLSLSLIDKKYAYPVYDSINVSPERLYCESYPSFEMLETGKYPSIQAIHKMKIKGFDYDRYDQSIAPNLKI